MRAPQQSMAVVGFAACVFAFTAGAAHADECKPVHASIVANPIFGCPTSPIGLCTSGAIEGNHGLRGSTFFTADSAAPGPGTAPNAAATISYSGVLEIATAHGMLVMRDTGIFDQATGIFSSYDVLDSDDSTGAYAGATGTLFIGGTMVNGQFVTTVITGEVCLP